MTAKYIQALVGAYPAIREIWLFGSRANGTATVKSDWDYLAFTDDAALLNLLHLDIQFSVPGIDLFCVGTGGKTAMNPWPDEKGWKQMCLDSDGANFAWTQISDREARYKASKRRNPDDSRDFAVDVFEARAQLIYRQSCATEGETRAL